MTERWATIEKLFAELVHLPLEQRTPRLSRVAIEDPQMHRELESLLAVEQPPAGFLDSPPALARELRQAMTGQYLEGRQLGHYVIDQLVQEGGMSLVFRAHDQRDGNVVALKLLQPEAAKAAEQIKSEVEALRGISHPAVVKLLDYGQQNGFHYLVMEFVEGQTLRAVLAGMTNSPLRTILDSDAAADLAHQLIGALAAVHRAGLVHADIKPENLMITPGGQLRIVDFGLSKSSPKPLSVPETVTAMAGAGTLAYSSPELIRGSPATPRSDIFATGCVLFEILTGHQLYRGKTVWAVAESILQSRPSLRSVNPAWRHAMSRCLNPDPRKRFADGAALVKNLSRQAELKRFSWLAAMVAGIAIVALLVSLLITQFVRSSNPAVVKFDLAHDWRANRNPNGVWTYAQGETPLPYQPKLGLNGCWGRELGVTDGYAEGTDLMSGCVPAFIKATGAGINNGFQKDDILIASQDTVNGPNEGPATLIWTAPTNGNVVYQGEIWYAEIGLMRSDDFTLSVGTKILCHASIFTDLSPDGKPKPVQFSSLAPVSMQAGQKMKLRVMKGNESGSFVALRLAITETASSKK